MATKTESPMLDIEFYIQTAETHGAESEPDHEVGDLQDFLRAAWELFTPEQKLAFSKNARVHETLQGAMVNYDEFIESLS